MAAAHSRAPLGRRALLRSHSCLCLSLGLPSLGDGGVAQFGVRYGAVPLQLQPGKAAVEVTKLADLPAVIKTLLQAVEAGELDPAVAAAVGLRGAKPNKAVFAKA